jgi:HK97 family phage portal protein
MEQLADWTEIKDSISDSTIRSRPLTRDELIHVERQLWSDTMSREKQVSEYSNDTEIHFLPQSFPNTSIISRDPTTMKYANEAYARNSIVNECVGIRVEALQSAPMKVYDAKDHKKELPDCHLQHILNNPNPVLDQTAMLLYLEAYLDVGGNMYMHKVRDGYGIMSQLYPYHASQMTPVLRDGIWITNYLYDNWAGWRADIEAKNIIHFRWNSVNFQKTWLSDSPILAVAKEIDIDNESAEIEIATLLNGMVVPFAIIPAAETVGIGKLMTDQQIKFQLEKLRTRYGGKNRGNGMILNPGTDIKPVGVSPKDFGNLTSRQISETRIPAVLKIPLTLTGLAVSISATALDNHSTDVQTFAQRTISHMGKIANTFNQSFKDEQFEDGKGSDFFIAFDTKQMPALQEVEWQKRKQVSVDYTSGILKLDEARFEFGLPPDDTGKGGKYSFENMPVQIKSSSVTE